ncbi:MAG TPA: YciI family protein [Candidatus Acidoferrum sp.]|nr:YciI family protein [Candidatus Acidoferrum sp.]
MEYMLLIYNSEADGKKMSAAEQGQIYQEYMTFTEDISKAGKNKASNALEPSTTATTVRVRNGKTVVTDGPFAETKEQLGGYYLVEAKDLDEAISMAARIPSSKYGSTEVRAIRKLDM